MAYRFKHGDRPLDDYTIQRAVGTGGFGEVYYAVSDGGREVALKYLRQNPEVELRGVSHCINLKSPHLVSIFDVKKNADGEYFIIMEYCSGPSLRDLLIAEPQGFSAEKAAFFVREIAKGLAYLHDRGIVHRDLKPGNIFFDDGYVKIGDYGLSKFIAVSRHSAQTVSVGTVHYMAPEIGSGNYSRGVDIYALGVILYEMILGKVPFEGSSMAEILMKHLTQQPEIDELQEPFGKVIRKALQKDPKDRYQSVDQMVDDLLAVETVKKSLAGFSPQSLQGAMRRGGADPAHSPIPSPNPMPGFGGLDARLGPPPVRPQYEPVGSSGNELPRRVNKRVQKVTRRMNKRLAKLGDGSASPPPVPPQGTGVGERVVPMDTTAPRARAKRFIPAAILTVGLTVGIGLLFGSNYNDEIGVSASLMTLAMALAIGVSHKASNWLCGEDGPGWARMIVRLVTSGPFMLVAIAPWASRGGDGADAFGAMLGLLAVVVFGNWDTDRDIGRHGELSFGSAFGGAIFAFITCVIAAGVLDARNEEISMFFGAAVAAAVTLIVQANMWWLVGGTSGTSRKSKRSREWRKYVHLGIGEVENGIGGGKKRGTDEPPFAQPIGGGAVPVSMDESDLDDDADETPYTVTHNRRVRSGFARAFWSLTSFILFGASMFLLLLSAIADGSTLSYDDRTGTVIGCIACFAVMIFALRKTTTLKRDGFWRETVRPFLITVLLFGIGASITGLARGYEQRHYIHREEAMRQAQEVAQELLGQLHSPDGRAPGDRPKDRAARSAERRVEALRKGQYESTIDLSDEGKAGLITALVTSAVVLIAVTFFTGRRRRRPARAFLRSDHPGSGFGGPGSGGGRAPADRADRYVPGKPDSPEELANSTDVAVAEAKKDAG